MSADTQNPARAATGSVLGLHQVGLNLHSANSELLEAFAFSGDEAARWVETVLLRDSGVREAAVISTCNRTEAYLVVAESESSRELLPLLTGPRSDLAHRNSGAFAERVGLDGARQMFRVACGLDSIVVGEAQILGQVRDAYELAKRAGGIGPVLERLFQSAMHAAKRSRSETEIGRGSVSVASAACDLAIKVVGDLKKRNVLVVGAGETGSLAARHLKAEGPAAMLIANRTLEKAEELAREVGGRAATLDALPTLLREVDVVVTATSSPVPVFTQPMIREVLRGRSRSLVFVDIAIPRDVDPKIHDLDGAFVYGMEALDRIVKDNLSRRQREIPKVESIVEEELQSYARWLASRSAGSVIVELRERFETVRRSEVERMARGASAAEQEMIERLTRGIVNKLLHAPTSHLRNGGASDPDTVELVRQLFQLNGDASGGASGGAVGGTGRDTNHSSSSTSAGSGPRAGNSPPGGAGQGIDARPRHAGGSIGDGG
ncbi:MAG: glutamyl-tRNA reductase [Candidatus Eisenbacteria bacterium]|nr:glutamyl-tRNA reductase [Candidatus Eisenbacteria bacterium]